LLVVLPAVPYWLDEWQAATSSPAAAIITIGSARRPGRLFLCGTVSSRQIRPIIDQASFR
jgi:hypothetical protein